MSDRRSRREILAGGAIALAGGSAAAADAHGSAAQEPGTAGDLPYVPGWRGGTPRDVADRLRDIVSILDFIPQSEHAAIRARTSTADVSRYFAAAIAHIEAAGGGELYIPAGRYRCGSTIRLTKYLRLRGAGKIASHIQFTHAGTAVPNGSGFALVQPSNTATEAYVTVSDLFVEMTHPANAGACFYDNCSTYVTLRDCTFARGKYGVVFDQTEVSGIYSCNMAGQTDGGAGLWLVNGGDITRGNHGEFTNQITVDHNCQFNETTYPDGRGAYAILDDGGLSHYYGNNNVNGGGCRFAGCSTLTIMGGEFESVNGRPTLTFTASTRSGAGVGGCSAVVVNCQINQPSPQPGILIASMYNLDMRHVKFNVNVAAGACVMGVESLGTLFARQNINNQAAPIFNTYAAGMHDDGYLVVKQLAGTAHTLSLFWNYALFQTTSASPVTITVPSTATEAIPIGGHYRIEQFGTGTVTLRPARGVTLHGTVSTTGQYQMLTATKTAADRWLVTRQS